MEKGCRGRIPGASTFTHFVGLCLMQRHNVRRPGGVSSPTASSTDRVDDDLDGSESGKGRNVSVVAEVDRMCDTRVSWVWMFVGIGLTLGLLAYGLPLNAPWDASTLELLDPGAVMEEPSLAYIPESVNKEVVGTGVRPLADKPHIPSLAPKLSHHASAEPKLSHPPSSLQSHKPNVQHDTGGKVVEDPKTAPISKPPPLPPPPPPSQPPVSSPPKPELVVREDPPSSSIGMVGRSLEEMSFPTCGDLEYGDLYLQGWRDTIQMECAAPLDALPRWPAGGGGPSPSIAGAGIRCHGLKTRGVETLQVCIMPIRIPGKWDMFRGPLGVGSSADARSVDVKVLPTGLRAGTGRFQPPGVRIGCAGNVEGLEASVQLTMKKNRLFQRIVDVGRIPSAPSKPSFPAPPQRFDSPTPDPQHRIWYIVDRDCGPPRYNPFHCGADYILGYSVLRALKLDRRSVTVVYSHHDADPYTPLWRATTSAQGFMTKEEWAQYWDRRRNGEKGVFPTKHAGDLPLEGFAIEDIILSAHGSGAAIWRDHWHFARCSRSPLHYWIRDAVSHFLDHELPPAERPRSSLPLLSPSEAFFSKLLSPKATSIVQDEVRRLKGTTGSGVDDVAQIPAGDWALAGALSLPLARVSPSLLSRPFVVTLVSRRPAGALKGVKVDRQMHKEEELLAALRRALPQEAGFLVRTVDFASIPVVEQVQSVRETDVLVGAHGAGLFWTMFLPPGSALVALHEFMGKAAPAKCYVAMALRAGVCHSRLRMLAAPPAPLDKQTLVVDIGTVLGMVRRAVVAVIRTRKLLLGPGSDGMQTLAELQPGSSPTATWSISPHPRSEDDRRWVGPSLRQGQTLAGRDPKLHDLPEHVVKPLPKPGSTSKAWINPNNLPAAFQDSLFEEASQGASWEDWGPPDSINALANADVCPQLLDIY